MSSVMAFLKQFPDDDACWSHLERVRWPDGPICPKCGNVGPTMKCGRAHYHLCKACNAKFTVAMGTPLEGTHLPMRTWFTALYLLAVSSKGLSSVALGRHLGIGQKTAWFLGHRIRAMMADDTGLLRGIVEADETYIGGKRKRGQKSKRDGDGDQPKGRGGSRKAMVVTAVERGGKAGVCLGRCSAHEHPRRQRPPQRKPGQIHPVAGVRP
jgi:transposase-like protein